MKDIDWSRIAFQIEAQIRWGTAFEDFNKHFWFHIEGAWNETKFNRPSLVAKFPTKRKVKP